MSGLPALAVSVGVGVALGISVAVGVGLEISVVGVGDGLCSVDAVALVDGVSTGGVVSATSAPT